MAKKTPALPNESVPVMILPDARKGLYSRQSTERIQKEIRDVLLLPSMETYHSVQVHVEARDGRPAGSVVAYMLREHSYTADVVRMELDQNLSCVSVERSYQPGEVEEPTDSWDIGPIGRKAPQAVFGTPVPEIPTAKAAVDYASALATRAGLRVVKLLGPRANLANYKSYLTAGVVAFGNVGHGFTGGIILADGTLSSAWFSGLRRPLIGRSVSPAVIYFNSCQVFNPPLEPAIMAAGARTFIGGRINLLIGPSENVFKCFWTNVLRAKKKMGPTLVDCEKKHYPTPGAHGIDGDKGAFWPASVRPVLGGGRKPKGK